MKKSRPSKIEEMPHMIKDFQIL